MDISMRYFLLFLTLFLQFSASGNPDKRKVEFEYDALGRRTAKIFDGNITRWVWDGNTPLHEWTYPLEERPKTVKDEFGFESKDREEPIENLITWIFEEGTFKPAAKLTKDSSYSIITDYLGTPAQAYDAKGKVTWERELDIYGKTRKETGISNFVPFRYPGQYFDEETGVAYNRFRYYSPDEGIYISQDPIGLRGGHQLYGYVHNPMLWIDVLGLLGKLTEFAKQIAESGDHFLSRELRTVAVGEDSMRNLYAASSNGLDAGQQAKALELGVTPLNTSTMHIDGQNLHAEEVLLHNVDNLEAVGTWKRTPCGEVEHNCAQQLSNRGVKVECR
jgi:RHS repeat-associated protein